MEMTLDNFLNLLGLQKPLVAIQGDIFKTPANHIAFAVHWKNNLGYSGNGIDSGFAAEVAKHGWKDLCKINFRKGEPVSKLIKGKWFHALPVHTNEQGGWNEAPELIKICLDKIQIPTYEVITTVLIGGGRSGEKYKASVRNLEGMVKSYKTVVLYIHPKDNLYDLLAGTGVIAQPLPNGMSLLELPKVIKFREYKRLIEKISA